METFGNSAGTKDNFYQAATCLLCGLGVAGAPPRFHHGQINANCSTRWCAGLHVLGENIRESLTIFFGTGLMLAASVDDEQVFTFPITVRSSMRLLSASQSEQELADIKSKVKQIFRRLNRNSEPQASIESGQYTLQ